MSCNHVVVLGTVPNQNKQSHSCTVHSFDCACLLLTAAKTDSVSGPFEDTQFDLVVDVQTSSEESNFYSDTGTSCCSPVFHLLNMNQATVVQVWLGLDHLVCLICK